MNNDLIWTSWEAFTLTAPPSASPTPASVISLKPPSPTVIANGLVVGQPHLIEVGGVGGGGSFLLFGLDGERGMGGGCLTTCGSGVNYVHFFF